MTTALKRVYLANDTKYTYLRLRGSWGNRQHNVASCETVPQEEGYGGGVEGKGSRGKWGGAMFRLLHLFIMFHIKRDAHLSIRIVSSQTLDCHRLIRLSQQILDGRSTLSLLSTFPNCRRSAFDSLLTCPSTF